MKKPEVVYPFRYYFRPQTAASIRPVVVREAREEELNQEELGEALRQLTDRQWWAVKQLLLEAKAKADGLLHDEKTASDHGRLAFFTGMVAYSSYVLASFEQFREV